VTEGYAKKKELRKLDGRATLASFAETMPTFGDVYEASVTDRWGRQHLLEVVAVPWIYVGPAMGSTLNLRTRYLQTYTPLSEELQQKGHLHRSGLLAPASSIHQILTAFGCGHKCTLLS
jgi:hypothetical protein